MARGIRYLLQILNYLVFMVLIGYFSFSPPYRQLDDDQAVITMAIAHAGERLEACRKLSPEELAALPPNMRLPMDCPRERSPVTVELFLDGKSITRVVAVPPGLYNDQAIDIYDSVKVTAGKHLLAVQMNDNINVDGPTHNHEQTVMLEPAQLLVIEYQSSSGAFTAK